MGTDAKNNNENKMTFILTQWRFYFALLAIIGGIIGLTKIHQQTTASLSIIASFAAAIIGIILFFQDRLSSLTQIMRDIENKLEKLSDGLREVTFYGEIINAEEGQFCYEEMIPRWRSILSSFKHDFRAVNYLSKDGWDELKGTRNLKLVSGKASVLGLLARRIFILENEKELELWDEVFEAHKTAEIEIKALYFEDAMKIRAALAINNPVISSTVGFNIIDVDNNGIGIVVDWSYEKNRKTTGAKIMHRKGEGKIFELLFHQYWTDGFDPLSKNLVVAHILKKSVRSKQPVVKKEVVRDQLGQVVVPHMDHNALKETAEKRIILKARP